MWKVPFTTPWVQNAVTPIVDGDTVVLAGGRLYGLSHRKRGQLSCLDARRGRTPW
jgi:hypothetical protein